MGQRGSDDRCRGPSAANEDLSLISQVSHDADGAFAVRGTIASHGSHADIHPRRCRTIASRLARRTSGLGALDTNHRRGCFPTASYCRADTTVLAALDTTRFRQP
jgi:hypothetical protein